MRCPCTQVRDAEPRGTRDRGDGERPEAEPRGHRDLADALARASGEQHELDPRGDAGARGQPERAPRLAVAELRARSGSASA